MNTINALLGWVDQWLGRITMYALVLYSLVAMALTALVLMFFGELDYSPLWFILSIVVSVGVAHSSNHIFGWLFGVKPHSESAWITGLILALLFIPVAQLAALIKIALVAMIAMASKYVIAFRNRHIFNPAAIAVVIASFGGLYYAGWWVATPGMIPVTLVAAILILRRTQKLRMAAIFIAVALAGLWVQGVSPLDAISSWPLLFIAGIMLSEPLTLPPRAKQQYIEAVVVAALMTMPLSYGRVTMTPALAIVLGNVIGWWFGQRQSVKLRFSSKKQMGAYAYEFVFDSPKLRFEPGQYLELSLVHPKSDIRGHRRVFSIASKPGDEQLTIGTKIPTRPSSFKRALMNLKPGMPIYATRISGDLVLPKDTGRPIVCIAGGIGITPYISFIESSDRPLRIIYAVDNISELSFVDILKQHNVEVVVVSPNGSRLPDSDWKHEKTSLNVALLKKYINADEQPLVYVSGPPAMVLNVKAMVKDLGVKDVKIDEFIGY